MDKTYYEAFFRVQEKHWWFTSKKKIILGLLENYVAKDCEQNILDIGCGSGLMLNDLSQFGAVTGMDASNEAINFSRQIFNGKIVKGALPTDIPFNENSFQLIVALDVIEHIDDDICALRKIYSIARTGGVVVLTVPAYQFLWSRHDILNEHKRRYTLSELKKKVELSGFQIEKITYFNSLLFIPIAFIRLVNYLLKRESDSDVKIPHPYVNLILRQIFSLESKFIGRVSMPFGVSLACVLRK
jgi:SAM-dependent methyltransferase